VREQHRDRRQPVFGEQRLQRPDGLLAGVDHDARLPPPRPARSSWSGRPRRKPATSTDQPRRAPVPAAEPRRLPPRRLQVRSRGRNRRDAVATNQMRRDAAKRKLAASRRGAPSGRRRQMPSSARRRSSWRLLAVVALHDGRGGDPRPTAPSDGERRPRPPSPPVAPARDVRLPSTERRERTPRRPPRACREGTVRSRCSRPADRPHPEGRGALHGGQLRPASPGRATSTAQCHRPHGEGSGAAVRRPDRHRDRRPGLHDPDEAPTTRPRCTVGQGTVVYPRGTCRRPAAELGGAGGRLPR
jgi:hypothetical protein